MSAVALWQPPLALLWFVCMDATGISADRDGGLGGRVPQRHTDAYFITGGPLSRRRWTRCQPTSGAPACSSPPLQPARPSAQATSAFVAFTSAFRRRVAFTNSHFYGREGSDCEFSYRSENRPGLQRALTSRSPSRWCLAPPDCSLNARRTAHPHLS